MHLHPLKSLSPATSPLTLHRRPSRASVATPHGTYQDKAPIPGTTAIRSYFLHFPFPPFSNHRSQLTIHNLICTLSDRLGYHGVATRAQAIFDSIMQRTSIKWGKAAKLAAAAAVVFAMREQGRGDRTHYVAVSTSFPLFSLSFELVSFHVVPPKVRCSIAMAAASLGSCPCVLLGPSPYLHQAALLSPVISFECELWAVAADTLLPLSTSSICFQNLLSH